MGRRGPQPTSKEVKLARGRRAPSQVNYAEPQPASAVTRAAPGDLEGPGLREWERLIDGLLEYGYLAEADIESFADYCRRVSDLRHAEQMVREDPKWLAAVIKLQDQVNRLRVQCGLTPASRSALKRTTPVAKSAQQGATYLEALKKGA